MRTKEIIWKRKLLLGVAISLLFSVVNLFSVWAAEMPEFTTQSAEHWINSSPMKVADLKGKIVLIEVWTSI